MSETKPADVDRSAPEAFLNRELSWLSFARRVFALAENEDVPLLERVKFVGILGMLHDEFLMKRMSGLKRQLARNSSKRSVDGRRPAETFALCRDELRSQDEAIAGLLRDVLRPELTRCGLPILDVDDLEDAEREQLRATFRESILPILTPLAVDAEHPFPFISNLGLNLAVLIPRTPKRRERFVRIKVPDNRPRWVPLANERGFVPLEQVISSNLDLLFPHSPPSRVHLFRVTRGAEGDPEQTGDLALEESLDQPGSIVRLVSHELKARRFAGVVRLQVEPSMPADLREWLTRQLEIDEEDVYDADHPLGLRDLVRFDPDGHEDLRYPPHHPVTHPRLRGIPADEPDAIFDEISRGDVLLHHPYHSFDTSVLRFLEAAAVDPGVLAIKLTIYRTSSDSPIVRALAEAVRRGKQVAVLVEITARFDEAPNIQWGQYLEKEGAHVSYGVESLKTHVKLALVVREESNQLKRYVHVGTGNYHSGTARVYEDLGLLTCDPAICDDAAAVFNALTGASAHAEYQRLLVAPSSMRKRFVEMVRREAEHARAGRPCGIVAKMNQLQDQQMIEELYAASQAGVPIRLYVRGLSCLRPGVPGLSETIQLTSVVGRFLEHSRIYRFVNGGDDEIYIGSADWMRRNLDRRVETIAPILDPSVRAEIAATLDVYEQDNASAWDCNDDGTYVRRRPGADEPRRAVQEMLIERAHEHER